MPNEKKIKRALISVFYKDGLENILKKLAADGVEFLSTGGTRTFIEGLGYQCAAVEDCTGYPSILGGRVKTLHPAVFGGILNRRDNESDQAQCKQYDIADIDLVIVDLYPFEATIAAGATEAEAIEKIDIGGISLIRAAAKNFNDVVIVASKHQYAYLEKILDEHKAAVTTLEERKYLAAQAFAVSSGYDTAIFNWFSKQVGETTPADSDLRVAVDGSMPLRYGENPHQQACFYGNFNELFDQVHGKEISYNNLLDIDAACSLIDEFGTTTVAVLKHNNACGCASRPILADAWKDALAGDPVSAFGGIIITNTSIDAETAAEMNKIFFEVVIAPGYDAEALDVLKQKKNRIILVRKAHANNNTRMRSILGGMLVQQADTKNEQPDELRLVSGEVPSTEVVDDLLFANKLVKNSKSNAITLAKNGQLLASGVGQTSRVDALKQAIEKARSFGFELNGAVMASDAFFPFADCVEIAHNAGITAVIQPGGSIRDNDSIEFCREHGMTMVMTGFRHFRH